MQCIDFQIRIAPQHFDYGVEDALGIAADAENGAVVLKMDVVGNQELGDFVAVAAKTGASCAAAPGAPPPQRSSAAPTAT